MGLHVLQGGLSIASVWQVRRFGAFPSGYGSLYLGLWARGTDLAMLGEAPVGGHFLRDRGPRASLFSLLAFPGVGALARENSICHKEITL